MKRENLKFQANLIYDDKKLENINCEIIFPKKQDDKVLLIANFLDADDIAAKEIPFIFSIDAKFPLYSDGSGLREISVSKVYRSGLKSYLFGKGKTSSILEAEPVDLMIRERHHQSEKIGAANKTLYLWLTQSYLLTPSYSIKYDYLGNVSIENHENKSFKISDCFNIECINYHFHYQDKEINNIRISESVLAVETQIITDSTIITDNLITELETFLKLVSLVERRRIVWYGYKILSETESVDFYRGDFSIPSENFDCQSDNTLIPSEEFDCFIEIALLKGRECKFKEHLFDAIGKAAYRDYSSLEAEYLSYYSALENLLNGFKDVSDSHYIIGEDNWSIFVKHAKKHIKDCYLFEGEDNKEKRKLIYDKLSELNRPSFKSSFETFQKAYDIDVNDLWNLTGKQSLSIIRNKIVHGQLIDRREKEYDAIICAKLHLKWILERCLLRLLGWEIERSRVKPSILKQFAGYDDWEEKKTLLKNW